jgi:predicted DNA-binding ribbon-helix-helix protein
MREDQFMKFLEQDTNITSKTKSVNSRMSRARKVEDTFNVNLDNIVNDDEKTYQLLRKLYEMKDISGNLQNAVRKYYIFVNNKEFPSLATYEKRRRIS